MKIQSRNSNGMNLKSIRVIYEDKNILVIDKPAGLVVHADGKTKEATLVDWLVKKYPKMKKVGEPIVIDSRHQIQDSSKESSKEEVGKDSVSIPKSKIPASPAGRLNLKSTLIYRPGIVHRLDRETSGVMVIAKNQETFIFLKQQFQERLVKKAYRAFVYGELKNDRGIIDRPIGRSGSDFRRFSAQRGARGEMRAAKTLYRVLARAKGFSYIEVMPQTGRTHQIRVHLKAINYPIVCDQLYAPKMPCALGFKRTALHAKSLTLKLPNGETESYEAPMPLDFKKAEKSLGFLK